MGAKCSRPHGGHGAFQPSLRNLANPSRRTDPWRSQNVPNTPTGRSRRRGSVTKSKYQTCQLHASESPAPPIGQMKGRDNAASSIYKTRTRFPPRLRGAYGTPTRPCQFKAPGVPPPGGLKVLVPRTNLVPGPSFRAQRNPRGGSPSSS